MRDRVRQGIMGSRWGPLARRIYAAITRERNALYNVQTLAVMERVLRTDSNCVDVGCYKGSVLREMVRLAPAGTHFAFEPIPELYAALQGTFRRFANVSVLDLALSDVAGETSFQHVVSDPGYSGLRRRRYIRSDEHVQEIAVKTARLDDVVPDDVSIGFMKVDVEGAELLVFRGGLQTITRSRPVIVFEHGLGAADYYGTGPEDVYDVLVVQAGLRLSLMGEWLASEGRHPFTREAFSEEFWEGRNYYFMAHP